MPRGYSTSWLLPYTTWVTSQCEIRRLLDTVTVHKQLVTPSTQPYNHNVDVPMVSSEVSVPTQRQAHVVTHVKGTGHVNKHEMPDAWHDMGVTEREFQQQLVELNNEHSTELITTPTQPYSHNNRRATGRFTGLLSHIHEQHT